MARKKKSHDEEHIDESWLIPYADMLTLLLALFIVLFSMSSIDADKYEALKKAMNDVFNGGNGVMEYEQPVDSNGQNGSDSTDMPIVEETNEESEPTDQKNLAELQEEVNGYILEKNLDSTLHTQLSGEGLLISILDEALFDSGSAAVRRNAVELAKDISEMLVSNPPRDIVISGHTDNVPISNKEFKSNWHLSVMRAVNFMEIMLDHNELNEKHLSAKGFGTNEPVASNETEEGREKNRRVEVLVLPH